MNKTIGIDLGTTNSCVAVIEGGEPTVITNPEGSRTTPSVISTSKDGERLVGTLAKRQAVTNPKNTVYSVKRFMGRSFNESKNDRSRVSYETGKSASGGIEIKLAGKSMSPPELSAQILIKMKLAAESYLGHKVTDAVVTVPAYFNDSQRQATKDAGKIAGLNVKRIINEPTAAALSYGLDKKGSGTVAVFDLGGGTFDISILEVSDGVFEVRSTNGDTHLGGDDFDELLIDYLAAEFKRNEGIDLKKDAVALQRLREAAEKAKCELSSTLETEVNLPFITADASGPKHFVMSITRAKFDSLTSELLEKVKTPVLKALDDASIKAAEVDHVLLVGGSTRMPSVQELVRSVFKKEPGKDVNPDEVVALGAAIQGGVLTGDVKDVLLLDVIPLSLGIETLGGVTTKLIDRNSTIPTRKSEMFSTAADSQTTVDIHVLQGEREMAVDNKSIGRFQLTGIPPAPRGLPQIEVSFDIDANGILDVSAKDKATGKVQNIRIEASSGLSDAEIDRMVADAEEFASDDKSKREEIDARNSAEQMLYQGEKHLKDLDDKLTPDDKGRLDAAVERLRTALNSGSADEMRSSMSGLESTLHEVSRNVYSRAAGATGGNGRNGDDGFRQQPEGAGSGGGEGAGFAQNPEAGGENRVDADFTVIDD